MGRFEIVLGRLKIVVDRCGSLWDRCGSLWIVVGRCGSLWVVPGFSNYAPQLPLHCNPVISGVATIKTNARKTQCSILSFFRLFYKNTFLSMTWQEKEKKSAFLCDV